MRLQVDGAMPNAENDYLLPCVAIHDAVVLKDQLPESLRKVFWEDPTQSREFSKALGRRDYPSHKEGAKSGRARRNELGDFVNVSKRAY